MSIQTHSKFYYGYEVSDEAQWIDFDEGAGELSAELTIGFYSLTDFAAELERALNDAGSLTYTVTVNRTTRVLTIAASGAVELLVSSGSHQGTTAYGTAGFTGADRASATSHVSAATGTAYTTQFKLQSYVDPEDFNDATYGTVNKSASGKLEVVTFGTERFIEANIKYATNIAQGASSPIRNNATGRADLQALMRYMTSKGPLEFMPDEDVPGTFHTVILESTPDDSKGLKFKLKELYGQGLPGYFETGVLKFRLVE
jgi:hypothetical protein